MTNNTALTVATLLISYFVAPIGALVPGARVRVSEGLPGSFIMGTVLGVAAACADDTQPWVAVRLDGQTYDYGEGPGVEHRPIDQLEAA